MSGRRMEAAGQVERAGGCAVLSLWVSGGLWALLQEGPTCAPSVLWQPTPWEDRGRGALRGNGGEANGNVLSGGGAEASGSYILISVPSSAGRARPAASRPGLPRAPLGQAVHTSHLTAGRGKNTTKNLCKVFFFSPQVSGCVPPAPHTSVFNAYLKSRTLQR